MPPLLANRASQSPSVYVLVLNCNGAGWLERCLGSLLDCSYPRLQVVLVDNASTDHSVDLARSLSPKIEIIRNRVNLGFCEGNNVAIDYALRQGADYIALLNNDTWCEAPWIDRIVQVGEANSALGVLGPVQLLFDGAEFNSWTSSALSHVLDALRENDRPGAWFPVEWVEGSCLLARRAVFERIGRLDPIFFAFFEEIDFCRRARAAGYGIAVVPSSKVHHYRGGSFDLPRHTRQRRFLLLRNSMIYNSTDPSASLWSNLRGLVRNNAAHLKNALLHREDLPVWLQASWSVLLSLPALYRKWQADRRALFS